jgi:hypothetical protein
MPKLHASQILVTVHNSEGDVTAVSLQQVLAHIAKRLGHIEALVGDDLKPSVDAIAEGIRLLASEHNLKVQLLRKSSGAEIHNPNKEPKQK